jgi:AraC-like DNA-binding protein
LAQVYVIGIHCESRSITYIKSPFLFMSQPQPSSSEKTLWAKVIGTWCPLYGGIRGLGASIEWHDFRLAEDFDWTPTFHPGCLEICLNYRGQADFELNRKNTLLTENQLAWYLPGHSPVIAHRRANSIHRFFTLEVTRNYLERQFTGLRDRLRRPVQTFLQQPESFDSCVQASPMPSNLLGMRGILLDPPVPAGAEPLWYLGKILEILAHTLFAEPAGHEPAADTHNRERVEKARHLLARDMENPPSLDELARAAGCSPFHLSRIFAGETGVSIPKYLRMKRIEKAAELLLGGKVNVTEAAMAVGYSSLSAFNKAFVEQTGVCPGLYGLPLKGGCNGA